MGTLPILRCSNGPDPGLPYLVVLDDDSTTIIRNKEDLEGLVELEPFGDREHRRKSCLLAAFSKNPFEVDFETPFSPPDRAYEVVAATSNALLTVTDTASERTKE